MAHNNPAPFEPPADLSDEASALARAIYDLIVGDGHRFPENGRCFRMPDPEDEAERLEEPTATPRVLVVHYDESPLLESYVDNDVRYHDRKRGQRFDAVTKALGYIVEPVGDGSADVMRADDPTWRGGSNYAHRAENVGLQCETCGVRDVSVTYVPWSDHPRCSDHQRPHIDRLTW